MKKLYLHLGLAKTSSSSFQDTCLANKEELLSQGFYYPSFTLENNQSIQIANHSHPINSIYAKNPEDVLFNIQHQTDNLAKRNQHYLEELQAALHYDENLILSGEGILALEQKEITELFKLFREFYVDIEVFALVRPPYAFHCSGFVTHVYSGIFLNPATAWISQIKTIKKAIESIPYEINFFSFNAAITESKGPVNFLLKRLGIDTSNINFLFSNEGMSNEYVRVQNILNLRNSLIKDGKINPKNQQLNKNLQGEKFLLTKQEFENCQSKYKYECNFMVDKFGQDFLDDQINFSTPLPFDELMINYNEWI